MPPSDAWDSNTTSVGPPAHPTTPQLPAAPRSLGPRTFGAYLLLRRIGRGGLGDVYEARPLPSGPVVALKVLREGDEATPAERRSFLREVEVARRVAHPGLLPILDAGEIDGQLYFTMPLITGGNLEHRLRAGQLTLRQGVTILARVARAVHHAHDHGVLHRDLKPANILLNEQQEPLVADFGLARLVGPNTSHTITGVVMGSVPYMAPEQAAGQSHRACRATDVWPLGVILYELLAGRRPFQGTSQTEVLRRILHDPPTLPRRLRADAPPELEAICLRCLSKSLDGRYPSAMALADDLERWLEGRRVQASLDVTTRGPLGLSSSWFSAVAGLGALLLCLMSLGLLTGPGAAEPAVAPAVPADEQVRQAFARARPGRPLVLYEEGGKPRWQAMPVGANDTLVRLAAGQPLGLSTNWACLFELLPPDPKRGPFRLTAVIRQTNATGPRPRGTAQPIGPYLGRAQHPWPNQEPAHTFALLGYADPALLQSLRLEPGQGPRALLSLGRIIPQPQMPPRYGFHRPGAGVPLKAVPLGPRNQPAWRELVIEARPGVVGIGHDGASSEMKTALLAARFRASAGGVPSLKNVQPAFDSTGGAGLFVMAGSIQVRRVVVEPLPPAP